MKIDFRPKSLQTFFYLLGNYFLNLRSLEIYSIHDSSNFKLKLNDDNFPFNQFTRLDEFLIGTSNITFDLSQQLVEFLNKLEIFKLNVLVDQKGPNLNSSNFTQLMCNPKVASFELNLGIDLTFIRNNNLVLDKNPYELDELISEFVDSMKTSGKKLKAIQINVEIWPSLLVDINNLDLANFENLLKIDISSIHVHSHDSICKQISDIRCMGNFKKNFIGSNHLKIFNK